MLIDTFNNDGKPIKIEKLFFANADSDNVKELVIMATSQQKDAQHNGTLYINRVYDNPPRILPGRLKRLEDATAKIEGGFEGKLNGKPVKAKVKNENEIAAILGKITK